MEHAFTPTIIGILEDEFDLPSEDLMKNSELLQYLNIKTQSASRGSKSRAAFGNHYAIYVLVEDYVTKEYHESGNYGNYDGAKFSDLFKRQRQLPFGSKLQNHALNHRLNQEFRKFFPTCEYIPIIRNVETLRYWINENLLQIEIGDSVVNIAPAIIKIIDAYIEVKKVAFENFITACNRMQDLKDEDPQRVQDFIFGLLKPNVDARVFEIVSYAILKEFYAGQVVYWGWSIQDIHEDNLILYKTGRTNANDGGIDFVMKPLGRFFQVTESLDVKKYFLDIDKVQRYPMTFVVKSTNDVDVVLKTIRKQAQRLYRVTKVVQRYMDCVEEIINIPILLDRFFSVRAKGRIAAVINEIVLQSKMEFHYEEW